MYPISQPVKDRCKDARDITHDIAPSCKAPKGPSTVEWIHESWYNHAIEYQVVLRTKKIP